ncbi:Protein kinase of the Mitotic Exit Network [Recurvomyces mirabilis]|nr:Protein kinase of the Mitotic Exit Network [Recurvomyces mirabilis]
MPPPPTSPVTSRQQSSTKTTSKPSTMTKRPGSAASVKRPPSSVASRNGTPKAPANGISARVPATKARGSADKEASGGSRNDVKPGRRQSSAAAMRDKPPSKDGTAQRNAKEVEGLKDFQLGDCLGRGAFGSVYRALNWSTGETVAIKQVSTSNLARAELTVIMQEIDLLKNLNHPNIVKYHGFVKSSENLYIILEYCENGSLHSICKNFGKFPENLVSLYTAQVLQGLLFLHEQGVIHRDIKGANILTTKEGLVKLADFGVATKQADGSSVVGTPYWMAPEVIELSGASTASDIWSLGCTVIELLDGKPPYHKFAPMPALFRIVNDDHPPLPEGVSPLVRDFLMQCFQKDPNLRVSAKKLLRHPWILSSKKGDTSKAVKHEEAVNLVEEWNAALKFSPKAEMTSNGTRRASAKSLSRPVSRAKSQDPKAKHETSATGVRSGLQLGAKRERQNATLYASPDTDDKRDNWDNDFESLSTTFKALQLPDHRKPQDNFAGLFTAEKLKRYATDPMHDMDGKVEQWDEEFPDGELTVRSPLQLAKGDALETVRPFYPPRATSDDIKHKPPTGLASRGASADRQERKASRDSQPRTQILRTKQISSVAGVKAGHAAPENTKRAMTAPTTVDRNRYREDEEEDYSDLVAEDESAFQKKLAGYSPSRAYNPRDIRNMQTKIGGSVRRRTHTPTMLVHDAAAMKRTRSSLEMQKYAEDEEDEDFADVEFGEDAGTPMQLQPVKQRSPQSVSAGSSEGLGNGSEQGTLRLVGSGGGGFGSSWPGDDDEDDDEDDPFAALEEELDSVDLESNVARDKHARLCMLVEGLVSELKVSQSDEVLMEIVDQLSQVLAESPDVKNVIVASHGMLPILEILETCARPHTILSLLRIVNYIIGENVEVQENLCFVGGIPIVTKFAHKKFSSEIRLEAAAFVRMMYQTSTLTLQMFVSCGGLNVLVEFLEEDYDSEAGRELVLLGVNGVHSVFELQGPTPKNDFCRIFSRSSVLYPLSLVLSRILDEEDDLAEVFEGRIVNIFLLFSQAENHVKETVADRMVLKRVLKDLKRMTPQHQITMLKFIKNLSMLATTLDALQNSNAIESLTDLLASSMKTPHPLHREVSNQVLNTMYNLCRLSKSRQEDAALNGLIPLLQRIVQTERPLKEFALPILCDMAHSGKVGRMVLWQNKGLGFYVKLLSEPYWAVTALDAIFVWLQEETHKVEQQLLSEGINFTDAIVGCFNESKADAFEGLLEPLQKLLRLSRGVAERLAERRTWFERCKVKMHARKPLVRLNLLRILRCLCEAHEEQGGLLRRYGLLEAVQELAKSDQAILVREMAKSLLELVENAGFNGNGTRLPGLRRSSSSVVVMTPTTAGMGIGGPAGSSLPPTPGGTGDRHGSRGGFFDFGLDGAGPRARAMPASSPYRPVSRAAASGSGSGSSGSLPAMQPPSANKSNTTTRLAAQPRASMAGSGLRNQQSRLSLATGGREGSSRFSLAGGGEKANRIEEDVVQSATTPTHVPPTRGASAAVANARRRRQTSGAELGGRGT